MEFDNKILKNDVNKIKFIHTTLQQNSELSLNLDVRPIKHVTHETSKQPPKRQHYEKKDTELNSRQKQENNKSSEKSYESNNEKNESN